MLLWLFLLLPTPLALGQVDDWAAPIKDAITLQSEGRYKQAYEQLIPHANNENGLAQFNVALHHELGWSTPINLDKACYWYEQAAWNNMPLAMKKIADCIVNGYRQTKREETAYAWYAKAFEAGIYDAACDAGKQLLQTPHPTPNNIIDGITLCRTAAEHGSVAAALFVGKHYVNGEIVEKNHGLALHLLQHAAPDKHPEAAFYIGRIFDVGQGIQQDIKQSAYWYETAAAQGYGDAYTPLAALYWTLYEQSQQERARLLAKAYLWANAAHLYADGANSTEVLFTNVARAIPDTWRADLDSRVAAHMQQFHQL